MIKQKIYFLIMLVAIMSSAFLQGQQVKSSSYVNMKPEELVKLASAASACEILGIENNADATTIDKAFRKMRSAFSPTKWPSQEKFAIQAFKIIINAKEAILKNNSGSAIKESLIHLLINAAEKENTDLIAELLKEDVDVNAKTKNGITPLIAAAATGNSNTVEMLLIAGANPLLEGKWTARIQGTPRAITLQQQEEMSGWACLTTNDAKKERKEHVERMNSVLKILAAAEENRPAQ